MTRGAPRPRPKPKPRPKDGDNFISMEGASMESVARECLPDPIQQMRRYARLLHHPQYLEQMDDLDRDFVLWAASVETYNSPQHYTLLRLESMIDHYLLNKPRRFDLCRYLAQAWHGVKSWAARWKKLWTR